MSAIPLQRSKKWLEQKGWHVAITERWNQWAHVRQDLYGFADLLAIRADLKGVWAVNACEDEGEVTKHIRQYLNGWEHPKKGYQGPNSHLPVWLAGRNRFSLMGWGKRSSDGRGSRKVWTVRLVEFYLAGAEIRWKEIEAELP